jgi:hypothetical protein
MSPSLDEHLATFYAVASRAGAYEAQADAGDAVHLALEALAASDAPRAIEALKALVLELDRLLINISCRINIRKPETLRPLRTRLSGLRRRVTLTLKAHGISSNRAKSTSPRRIASCGALCPRLDEIGPRHLCVFGCFFREYEPSRMLRAFLSAASDAGHRRVQLAGWRVEVRRTATEDKNDETARKRRREERPAEDEPWLVDPAGGVHRTIKDALAALDADAPRGVEARGAVVDTRARAVVSTCMRALDADAPRGVEALGAVVETRARAVVSPCMRALGADAPRGVEARGAVVSRFFGNARHGAQGPSTAACGAASTAPAAAATNAGCVNAGCVNAGCVNAGCVNAGCVNAGCVNAGCVNAGCVNAGCVNAGCVSALSGNSSSVSGGSGSSSSSSTASIVASSSGSGIDSGSAAEAPSWAPWRPPHSPNGLLEEHASDHHGAHPWRPPHSPYGLLEELLWDRPWRLLLCCILLNQTSRAQVDPVLADCY